MITNRILIIVMFICLLLTGASLAYTWLRPQKIIVEKEYVKLDPVIKTKIVEVPIEKIKILEKSQVLKKIELPATIIENPNKQITTTGVVGKHGAETDVVSIIDLKNGESELYAKKRPLPFFEILSEAEIGVRYGLTTYKTGQEGCIHGRYNFVRLDKFYLGVYGEGNTRPEAKVMLDITYRP